MTNAVKKAKAIELKSVVAVAKLKMQVRRTMKEIETLMQNVDDTFTRTKANLLIGQDENGVSYGLQKIKRKRIESVILLGYCKRGPFRLIGTIDPRGI
jgi:hypothetical protein